MADEKFQYYKHVQEIPEVGEAVSIYECEPDDDSLRVQRFVSQIPETGDYDRLEVDWTMELMRDDLEQVEAEEFECLWKLDSG